MNQILFFHPRNDYTGSTRVLSNIISEEYKGQRINIITQKNGNKGFLSELSNVNIINVYSPVINGKKIFIFSFLVTQVHLIILALLHGFKYKVFYINTLIPYVVAIVARFYRKKIVWHVHEKFQQKQLLFRLMEYVFNRTSAHRIFVSHYVQKQYSKNVFCTSEVKYNKLSSSYIEEVSIKDINKRNRNQILMIGSMTLAKGIDVFIQLAESIHECEFKLILNANRMEIDNFFKQYEIPTNCEIIPAQSNIHPYLKQTDLILNLSNPLLCVETFGMTILEAMPYGIPAIVPNIGGPTELVINGYNGYCVDVTNLEKVISIIRKSLVKENYDILANNTINLFETRFK